jgi:hypothetical protein
MTITTKVGGHVTRVTLSSGVDDEAAARGGFRDTTELLDAMRNPLYQRSEAYRQEVARKIAASSLTEYSGPGSPERHQVLTEEHILQRDQISSQTMSDRDRASVAKFDAAQAKAGR